MKHVRITARQLQSFIEGHRLDAGDLKDLAVLTAENVLKDYLGADWVRRYLRGPQGTFFRAVCQGARDAYVFHHRLLSLAETLLNLQHTVGIDDVLRRMRRGEIESAVTEVEAARFLDLCRLSFRFHGRQSRRGSDYDMEVDLPEHRAVPCECKCKLEDTPLTAASVKHTLEKARRQLPRNRSGVIILKLPGAQMSEPSRRREVGTAVIDLFGRSGRVAGLVAWWEIWDYHSDGAAVHTMFRNDCNRNCRAPLSMDAFEPRPRRDDWISLFRSTGLKDPYRPA